MSDPKAKYPLRESTRVYGPAGGLKPRGTTASNAREKYLMARKVVKTKKFPAWGGPKGGLGSAFGAITNFISGSAARAAASGQKGVQSKRKLNVKGMGRSA